MILMVTQFKIVLPSHELTRIITDLNKKHHFASHIFPLISQSTCAGERFAFFAFHLGQWVQTVRAQSPAFQSTGWLRVQFGLNGYALSHGCKMCIRFFYPRELAEKLKGCARRESAAAVFCSQQFVWHPLETMLAALGLDVLLRVYILPFVCRQPRRWIQMVCK